MLAKWTGEAQLSNDIARLDRLTARLSSGRYHTLIPEQSGLLFMLVQRPVSFAICKFCPQPWIPACAGMTVSCRNMAYLYGYGTSRLYGPLC